MLTYVHLEPESLRKQITSGFAAIVSGNATVTLHGSFKVFSQRSGCAWKYMSHRLKVKVLWKMKVPDYRHFCNCFCNMEPHGWFGVAFQLTGVELPAGGVLNI